MCLSVCVFTFSNMNISETSCSVVTKFYLKHHCVGVKDALGFGSDQIRTLVSKATDSSHGVIMGKCCEHASTFIFYQSSSYLQVTRTTIISRTSSNFGQIRPRTAELAALGRLEKSP